MKESRNSLTRLSHHITMIAEAESKRRRKQRSIVLICSLSLAILVSMLFLTDRINLFTRNSAPDQDIYSSESVTLSSSNPTYGDSLSGVNLMNYNSILPFEAPLETIEVTPNYSQRVILPNQEQPNATDKINADNPTQKIQKRVIRSASTTLASTESKIQELSLDEILFRVEANNEQPPVELKPGLVPSANTSLNEVDKENSNGMLRGEEATVPILQQPEEQVDIPPQFPGGRTALSQYIQNNINYPIGVSKQEEGTVVIRFIIEVDGSVSKPVVMKSLGRSFDQEAIQLISSMPHWYPGRKNGNLVPSYKEMGITFKQY